MTKEQLPIDKGKVQKPSPKSAEQKPSKERRGQTSAITRLQQQVGNRALQRLIAQRSGQEPADLDDETASRINQARGGGQSLDEGTQEKMGNAMGQDFSDVRVHTSSQSNQLNRELGAQAFTTGNDVFFSEGSYDPNTSGGKELIAHELTHVVQQGSGQVGSDSSGRMTVNAPGDAYEQQADAVANEVKTSQNAGVQRQDEEELMMKPVQRQEEEEMMMKPVQRQEEDEGEEYVMTKAVQRQEEEEMMQPKLQRQEEEEEAME